MTQILYQQSFRTFSENKYGQNHGQCFNGALDYYNDDDDDIGDGCTGVYFVPNYLGHVGVPIGQS